MPKLGNTEQWSCFHFLHKERLVSYTCNLPLHELRPYSQPQTAAEEGVSEVWALSPKLSGQAQGKEQGYSQ